MTVIQIVIATLFAAVFVTLYQVRKMAKEQKRLHKDVLIGLMSIRKRLETDQS